MYGLVDCNNFFVSCERIFNPSLRNRPVVVLSNNDGCAVALSNEAKALGIKRGNPFFEIRSLCEANNVAVFSGNHRLYGDISSRVMATISELVPEIEVYSVDEAFLNLNGIGPDELPGFNRELVRRIRRNVGVPVSLGVAHTKTLAKIGARFAKKFPGYRSVCAVDTEQKRRKALSLTPVGDVWGVGRRLNRRFAQVGIDTALDLADRPSTDIERLLNVTGQRTWRELNGEACISMEYTEKTKKQLCCSRSFGEMTTDIERLSEAIAAFSSILGRKLREQKICAVSLSVFLHTNAFRQDLQQYFNSAAYSLDEPTSDTMRITEAAVSALRRVYRREYYYKKAGILITETVPESNIQQSLFSTPADRERRRKLMSVVDFINAGSCARDTVHVARYTPVTSCMRQEHISRNYSTQLKDIIQIY
ncbi:MAG: Y-family DNA polymerase [Muribaculaceae bacterium]|nr:Y-family DNA polymerase [Muribaculaceae bacterium]